MKRIIIIGGGASGILALHELINSIEENREIEIIMIEKDPVLGGLAYNVAALPGSVLNTPISTMSAFIDKPLHLLEWLNSSGVDRTSWPIQYQKPWDADEFCPRILYGFYLRAIFDATMEQARAKNISVQRRKNSVMNVDVLADDHLVVTMCSGEKLESQILLLCIGQLNNANLPFFAGISQCQNYISDIWSHEGMEHLQQIPVTDNVLVVGTGLTANDIIFKRQESIQIASSADNVGHMFVVSRHARMHEPYPAHYSRSSSIEVDIEPIKQAILATRGELTLPNIKCIKALIKTEALRLHATGLHPEDIYRSFMRALIPFWSYFPEATRLFLFKKYKYLDVYRTGLSVAVSDCVTSMERGEKLTLLSAQVASICRVDNHFEVKLLVKTNDRDAAGKKIRVETIIQVQQIINAAGFDCDLRSSSSPLIQDMLTKGMIAPNYLGLGADSARPGQLYDQSKSSLLPIFAIGALVNGCIFEAEGKLGSARSMAGIRKQVPCVIKSVLSSPCLVEENTERVHVGCVGFFSASTSQGSERHLQQSNNYRCEGKSV